MSAPEYVTGSKLGDRLATIGVVLVLAFLVVSWAIVVRSGR